MVKPTAEVVPFVGKGGQEGNVTGPASSCRFMQPVGICIEFGSVVYVCARVEFVYVKPEISGVD